MRWPLRRAWGRVRWLPADLLGLPLLAVGLGFLVHLGVVTNRVADGPYTVRVLLATPAAWFTHASGWLGLLLIAVGALLVTLAVQLGDPHRALTVVRYRAFAFAALAAAVGAVLSAWRAYGSVTDTGDGIVAWRFYAAQRTQLGNDVTTVVLAIVAGAAYALSFGPRRWADFQKSGLPATIASVDAGPMSGVDDVVFVEVPDAPDEDVLVAFEAVERPLLASTPPLAQVQAAVDALPAASPPSSAPRGPGRPAQRARRVPTSSKARATRAKAAPKGVRTQRRSVRSRRPDDGA